MAPTENEDMEVNVVECTEVSNNGQVESRCEDAVETTSSFGDTLSDNGNALFSGEMEVESQLLFDDAPRYFGSEFRKRRKKLTDHWKRFIRPLQWRCKWLELQIKNLRCQSRKYDRELEKHEERKMFEFHTFVARGFDAKPQPFYSCEQRKKPMRRKKRKRIEEMSDVMPYMQQHNVFSYYDKAIDATDEFGIDDDDDEWPFFESKCDDNIRENCLGKIEVLQSQVRKLKARIEKVVSENPGKFSSVNMLRTPAASDVVTNSDQTPSTVPENGDQMPFRSAYTTPQHMSDIRIGNLVPESAVSSHGEITILDIIQSIGQPQVQVRGENTGDGILIDNQRAKDEIKDSLFF